MVNELQPTISCESLNRNYNHKSCGSCIENYIGDIFDTSTECIKNQDLNFTSKLCPMDCSNNGTCVYNDMNTGTIVTNCSISSSLCTANCDCNSNKFGRDCSEKLDHYMNRHDHQNFILSEMLVLISTNISNAAVDINEIVLAIMSSTLSMLTLSDRTISSSTSISLSKDIISTTMDLAIQHDIPSDEIVAFNDIISSFVGLSTNKDDDVKLDIQAIFEMYISTVSVIFLSNATAASNGVTISSPNMQITISSLQPVNSISSLSSGPPHELSIISSNRRLSLFDKHLPLVMSVTRASMYSTSDPNINNNTSGTNTSSNLPFYQLVSNPMYLQLNCNKMNDTTFKLVLQNYANQDLFDHVDPITKSFTTHCTANNQTIHTYDCQYTDGSIYTLSVPCYGNASYITTSRCPLRMRKPVCHIMSSIGSCELIEYNSDQFICSCSICSSNDYHARRLDTSSFAYQVAGAFEFLYDNYISTMADTDQLTGNSNNTI